MKLFIKNDIQVIKVYIYNKKLLYKMLIKFTY